MNVGHVWNIRSAEQVVPKKANRNKPLEGLIKTGQGDRKPKPGECDTLKEK